MVLTQKLWNKSIPYSGIRKRSNPHFATLRSWLHSAFESKYMPCDYSSIPFNRSSQQFSSFFIYRICNDPRIYRFKRYFWKFDIGCKEGCAPCILTATLFFLFGDILKSQMDSDTFVREVALTLNVHFINWTIPQVIFFYCGMYCIYLYFRPTFETSNPHFIRLNRGILVAHATMTKQLDEQLVFFPSETFPSETSPSKLKKYRLWIDDILRT